MNHSHPRFPAFFASSLLTIAFVLAAPNAHADVKVVSRTTISGASGPMASQMPSGPQNQTVYYKGAKIRMEADGGRVTLFDNQAKTLTLINTVKKSYTTAPMQQAVGQNPMLAMLDIKTTATLKPGGKTKTIAGKSAKNYLWQATISMSRKAGAAPGGTASAATPKMASGPLFVMKMDGEQWTTEAVKLPGAMGQSLLPQLSGQASAIPGLAPLISKLAGMKGLPLTSTIHQSFQQGPQARTITTQTEVVSITEAPLPDSLFAVPAGYTKIEAPRGRGGTPMMGM